MQLKVSTQLFHDCRHFCAGFPTPYAGFHAERKVRFNDAYIPRALKMDATLASGETVLVWQDAVRGAWLTVFRIAGCQRATKPQRVMGILQRGYLHHSPVP